MPYITQLTREIIDPFLENVLALMADGCSEGDLNYIITSIVHRWIEKQGLKYKNLNAAVGILDCAKMELYRMVAAPYEDKKISENGHISDLDMYKNCQSTESE